MAPASSRFPPGFDDGGGVGLRTCTSSHPAVPIADEECAMPLPAIVARLGHGELVIAVSDTRHGEWET